MAARFFTPFARLAIGLAAVLLAAATLGASAADPAGDSPLVNAKTFFWGIGQTSTDTAGSAENDLIYHGGNVGDGAIGVETTPAVYLIWWGPEWAAGFQTADTDGKLYSSRTLQSYLDSFFANVGGSPWAGVQTQYCNGVLPGSTSCVCGTGFIGNPRHQLKGIWVDPTPVPSDIVTLGLAENLADDPLAEEAQRAAAHFGYDSSATYIILTPPEPIATGQPVYCGYHSQTTSLDGYGNPFRLQYAFIPWLNTNWPGLGPSPAEPTSIDTAWGRADPGCSAPQLLNRLFRPPSRQVHEIGESLTVKPNARRSDA